MKAAPLGFRTMAEAAVALHEDGLASAEIIRRLGCPKSTVYNAISEHRAKEPDWPRERLDYLARVHVAAMDVIAEAFGIKAGQIPGLLAKASRLPPPAGEDITPPAPLPAASPAKPGATLRRYRFVSMDGRVLDREGNFTGDTDMAWSGSARAAKPLRGKWPNARFCKLREVGP